MALSYRGREFLMLHTRFTRERLAFVVQRKPLGEREYLRLARALRKPTCRAMARIALGLKRRAFITRCATVARVPLAPITFRGGFR